MNISDIKVLPRCRDEYQSLLPDVAAAKVIYLFLTECCVLWLTGASVVVTVFLGLLFFLNKYYVGTSLEFAGVPIYDALPA